MRTRSTVLLFLTVGCCWGRAETAVMARLKAELKESPPYILAAASEERQELNGEPVLELEPMTVTGSQSFAVDILTEARRAAAARAALKFSPLKGGLIYSSGRTALGLWPQVVPMDVTPVKKGTVGIAVDLLRIKW